jgi:hypothetical protein
MKKLAFTIFFGLWYTMSFGQLIGGGGIFKVIGNPNSLSILNVLKQTKDAIVAIDTTNGSTYVYDVREPIGSRWQPIRGANVSWGGYKITNLANGTASSDAVNLGQLQGSVNGSVGYLAKFTGGNSVGNSLVYDNGTNVGIGTTSPISRLHVTTSSASTSYVTIGNVNNGLLIGVAANGENQVLNYASKGLVFGGNFNGTQTEQMRIASNGNVGIGNASPDYKLDITGVTNNVALRVNTGGVNIGDGNGFLGFHFSNMLPNQQYFTGLVQNNSIGNFDIKTAGRLNLVFSNNTSFPFRIYSQAWNTGTSSYDLTERLKIDGSTGATTISGETAIAANLNLLTTNTQIIGGFGASVSSGAPNWNDVSNARSGNGYTLLLGSATNGTGLEPSTYYHPFSFEYNSRNGSGNMTQFAIPYTVGNNSGKLHFRSRYDGVWGAWQRIPTQAQTDADYGKLIGINNWTGSNNTFVGITANTVQANNNIVAKGTLQGYSGVGVFLSYETFGGRFESYDYSTGSWKNIAISPNGGNVGIGTTTPTAKLDINGVTRLRGMVEFATNTDFTYNAYYSSGWKYRTSGYAADIYQGGTGDITFLMAPSGIVDSPIPFVSTLRVLNSGGISVEGFKVQNVANATNANDAVNLSQAQNASNLTTGTIPDARISSNIARVDPNSNLQTAGAFSGGNSFSNLNSSIENYIISSYNSANSTNNHSIYLADLPTNVNSKTINIVNIGNTSVATGAVIRIYPPTNYQMSLTKDATFYELVLDAANTATSDNFTGTNKWKIECTVIRTFSKCNCFLVKN